MTFDMEVLLGGFGLELGRGCRPVLDGEASLRSLGILMDLGLLLDTQVGP